MATTRDLKKMKKQRTTKRNSIRKKILEKVDTIIANPVSEEQPIVEVTALLDTLELESDRIKKLDELIFDSIDEEADLEAENDDVMNLDSSTRCQRMLKICYHMLCQ